jgi:hypothetical protein
LQTSFFFSLPRSAKHHQSGRCGSIRKTWEY